MKEGAPKLEKVFPSVERGLERIVLDHIEHARMENSRRKKSLADSRETHHSYRRIAIVDWIGGNRRKAKGRIVVPIIVFRYE